MGLFWPVRGWAEDRSGDERRLLAAARRGDARAFDALILPYEHALTAFVGRLVGAHSTDDVVQETRLACWQALPKYTGRSSFKAWAFGIAHHKAMDHFRAQARQILPVAIEDDGSGLPCRGQSIEELYSAADLVETVQSALASLNAVQREVLELYYYEELTLAEISIVLNRNLNTVKYQFYRAHALVADTIEDGSRPQSSTSDTVPGSLGVRRSTK